jgi:hypothetical protein
MASGLSASAISYQGRAQGCNSELRGPGAEVREDSAEALLTRAKKRRCKRERELRKRAVQRASALRSKNHPVGPLRRRHQIVFASASRISAEIKARVLYVMLLYFGGLPAACCLGLSRPFSAM